MKQNYRHLPPPAIVKQVDFVKLSNQVTYNFACFMDNAAKIKYSPLGNNMVSFMEWQPGLHNLNC